MTRSTNLSYALIVLALLSLWSINAYCGQSYYYRNYQSKDGLSHNKVLCSLQDSDGFIWLGTDNGLNRFDGRENITSFNLKSQQPYLDNNVIHCLAEDADKRIWIGTNRGLYTYQEKEGLRSFNLTTRYLVSISSEVHKILIVDNRTIWFATLGQGIFVYHLDTQELEQLNQHATFVQDFLFDGNYVYTTSFNSSILCFKSDGTFLKTIPLFGDGQSSYDRDPNSFLQFRDALWIALNSASLVCMNKNGDLHHIDFTDVSFRIIHSLLALDDDEILLGTDVGLYAFNAFTEQLKPLDIYDEMGKKVVHHVNGLMRDREGGIWALTNMSGVDYIMPQTKPFHYVDLPGSSTVYTFCKDDASNVLWIGTKNGLFQYDLKKKTAQPYPLAGNTPYDIRSLFLDGNQLWIGTSADGLKVLNTSSGAVRSYRHTLDIPYTICSNDILKIYKTSEELIYVGTSWGLCYYVPSDDNFRTVFEIGGMFTVTDICEDGRKGIWVSTSNNGLYLCDYQTKKWWHFDVAPEALSNSMVSLFKGPDNLVWMGSNGNGLFRLDPDRRTFTKVDDVPNTIVYNMAQDGPERIWISSSLGLIRFNPKDKSDYHLFTTSDGLKENHFTEYAALLSDGRTLYLSGSDGFHYFDSDSFEKNSYIPPVYITDLSLLRLPDRDEAYSVMGIDGPLYKEKKVEIPYHYNSITIHFASLSYRNPAENLYSYKLENFDEGFFEIQGEHSVSYSNLPPGEYRFVVKGSNNDDVWNEHPATLTIVITPPWYRSKLAYLIYLLLLLTALFTAIAYWNRRVEKKYRMEMEEYEVQKEKELYNSKINFFINLVHEIRTPLSLIKLPLEDLKKNGLEDNSQKLVTIDRNVDYLLAITNELLDFQKMENNSMKLQLVRSNVSALIRSIVEQFQGAAELKGVRLVCSMPTDDLWAVIDRSFVNKITVNLLGNAMKYARNQITVALELGENEFAVRVDDDGPGVADEEKEKIFQAFYQSDDKQASLGTGLGLAYSYSLATLHGGNLSVQDNSLHGASFILTLPTNLEENALDGIQPTTSSPREGESSDLSVAAKKYTLLVVEDHVDLLRMVSSSLAQWYKVEQAANGLEALDVLENKPIDIIVSDVMMPGMDGMELCKRVKTTTDYSHIPVILLTAKVFVEAKEEGLSCGADVYMEKPFTISQLHMQIENLLKVRIAYYQRMQALSSQDSLQTVGGLNQKDYEFISELQGQLEKQYSDENFSVENLAEEMNMSRSNFYRKIKALTDMAPNDYLKCYRLNKAAEMLRKGYRVSETCAQTGFNSSSYFAKCFKAQFGMSPKEWAAGGQDGTMKKEEQEDESA